MTDPNDFNEDEKPRKKRKKKGEGEGQPEDHTGIAFVGAGDKAHLRLPPHELKRVTGEWKYFDLKSVVDAVAEFFGDLPLRASANLTVMWDKAKGFTIINRLISFGQKLIDQKLTREKVAGKDSRTLQNKREPQNKQPQARPDLNPKPSGV